MASLCPLHVLMRISPLPPAASVLLRVRVACARGVFAFRLSSNMKRGKKAEEEATAAAAENDPDSGIPSRSLILRCTNGN